MAEFPAMPFMTDAYLGDTMHLSLEEHGAYLKLLFIAWRTPSCLLPKDDARIATMLGITKGKWKKLKPTILAFWTETEHGFEQKKLKKIREKVREKSNKNRESAARRWDGKSLKNNDAKDANADANAMPDVVPKSCERNANQNHNHTKKESCAKSFTEFWEAFGDKRGKEPALRSWKAIRGYDAGLHAEIIAGARRYAAARPGLLANGGISKMAQGWLTDRRWEDAEAPQKTGPELQEFQSRKQA